MISLPVLGLSFGCELVATAAAGAARLGEGTGAGAGAGACDDNRVRGGTRRAGRTWKAERASTSPKSRV